MSKSFFRKKATRSFSIELGLMMVIEKLCEEAAKGEQSQILNSALHEYLSKEYEELYHEFYKKRD